MKTMVIRKGDTLTIRAVATPTDDPKWDKCETKAFLSEYAAILPDQVLKITANLADIAEKGPPQPHDDSKFKKLAGTDDLFEIKGGKLRLFCFWDDGALITTHGLFKQTQKTPKHELDHAGKIKKDYFLAKQNNALTHVEIKQKKH